jgi:hypothetical protein
MLLCDISTGENLVTILTIAQKNIYISNDKLNKGIFYKKIINPYEIL